MDLANPDDTQQRIAGALRADAAIDGMLGGVPASWYFTSSTLPGGGEVIRTGPGFVTPGNAAAVLELTRRGLR